MISQVGDPITIDGTVSPAVASQFTRIQIINRLGLPSFARKLTIRCEDATNALLVSLDGGATQIKVLANGGERTFDGALTQFSVKAAAATSQWSAIANVG